MDWLVWVVMGPAFMSTLLLFHLTSSLLFSGDSDMKSNFDFWFSENQSPLSLASET